MSFPDSPGYTAEQAAEVERLRRHLRALSITVTTHPYWSALSGEMVVEARMALKHVHERTDADKAT
ncbi:hypothetical protein [Streptomyces sp. NPDC051219]|uniref:hypothetical protein n=1 Tax=Streptomyces sp. NPDC051219 TaxID=3155283 RepID=UPI00342511FC